jgi:hypothetical protein
MKIQSLVFVTSALIVSLCQAQGTGDYDAGPAIVALPKSAEAFLLAKLPAKKISGISQLAFRRFREFDYLGVEGGFEVAWGASWETAFIHDFVLRKKITDPDWSKAELFESMPVTALFCSWPIDESELHPWKTPQPPANR